MIRREGSFLLALWRINLQSAIEYRAAFLTQVIGMVVNNALYFLFWVLFFSRFPQVGGWGLTDMILLFSVVAVSFGLATFLFGNMLSLAELISEGRLDYYLSLPRPPLLHALASRSISSGLGDVSYGLLTLGLAGLTSPADLLWFVVGVTGGIAVLVGFLVLVHSLAFWLGSAHMLASQATNAILTFAMYPLGLFDGTAKVILLVLVPAALVGGVPASLIRAWNWTDLALLLGGAAGFVLLALIVFRRGLRRYEGGSAIQVQV